MQLNNNEIKTIFSAIYHGVGNHGSFLSSFASAVSHADPQNFELLKDVAIKLIEKYDLNKDQYTSF